MRPCDSVTGTRCTQCVPPSYLTTEQATPRGREHLAHLGVVALVEQLLRAGSVVGGAAPFLGQLGRALQARVLTPDIGIALAVADHLGVGHGARELGEARLDLLDERLDHATTSIPILSS